MIRIGLEGVVEQLLRVVDAARLHVDLPERRLRLRELRHQHDRLFEERLGDGVLPEPIDLLAECRQKITRLRIASRYVDDDLLEPSEFRRMGTPARPVFYFLLARLSRVVFRLVLDGQECPSYGEVIRLQLHNPIKVVEQHLQPRHIWPAVLQHPQSSHESQRLLIDGVDLHRFGQQFLGRVGIAEVELRFSQRAQGTGSFGCDLERSLRLVLDLVPVVLTDGGLREQHMHIGSVGVDRQRGLQFGKALRPIVLFEQQSSRQMMSLPAELVRFESILRHRVHTEVKDLCHTVPARVLSRPLTDEQ